MIVSPARSWNFDTRKGEVLAEWFTGAQTNLSYNCLDRHVEAGKGERVAYFWEGNDVGSDAVVTYKQMLDGTCRLGNYLRSLGATKGTDVTLYMPMIPELPMSMVRGLVSFVASSSSTTHHCSWRARALVQCTAWCLEASLRSRWQTACWRARPR